MKKIKEISTYGKSLKCPTAEWNYIYALIYLISSFNKWRLTEYCFIVL